MKLLHFAYAGTLFIAVNYCHSQSLKPKCEDPRTYLRTYLKGSDSTTHVSLATTPLFGAGHTETLAYVVGNDFCGSGGCSLLILECRQGRTTLIGETTITHPPIRLLGSSNFYHPDLSVTIAGGGILHAYEAKLKFDGKRYPSNPTVQPAVKTFTSLPGKILIGVEDQGIVLF